MKIGIVGGGISGLASAALLAQKGYEVTLFEKNKQLGGRAWVFEHDGFKFDMGPSWYMMPDVYERYFAKFDKKPTDFYKLEQLTPSYKTVEKSGDLTVTGDNKKDIAMFEKFEKGAGQNLETLLNGTKKLYETVMEDFLYKDEVGNRNAMISLGFVSKVLNQKLYQKYHTYIKKRFKSEELQHILEFTTVFLGGTPNEIPAIYTLLAHTDIGMGIWYPQGGFGSLVSSLEKLCHENGVKIKTSEPVKKILVKNKQAYGLKTLRGFYDFDVVLSASEYQFTDNNLLDSKFSNRPKKSWRKKAHSPSGILINLGLKRKISGLEHHNLFFESGWDEHFRHIKAGTVPDKPLFYVSVPSISDASIAPKGKENMFVLVPIPAFSNPTDAQISKIVNNVYDRLSQKIDEDIRSLIEIENISTPTYFKERFNALGGNAFGLSHNLFQSSYFRPPIRHKKVKNLYFTGQNTLPGTGVPLVLISAEVSSDAIIKDHPING